MSFCNRLFRRDVEKEKGTFYFRDHGDIYAKVP